MKRRRGGLWESSIGFNEGNIGRGRFGDFGLRCREERVVEALLFCHPAKVELAKAADVFDMRCGPLMVNRKKANRG